MGKCTMTDDELRSFTKKCSKCGETKTGLEFSKGSDTKVGLKSQCKSCQSKEHVVYKSKNNEKVLESGRRYKRNNPEKVLASNRRYYEENRDTILAKGRERYWNNLDYQRERHLIYYYAHKEERSTYKKEYYELNKEIIALKSKVYYQTNRDDILKRAKDRETEESLTKKYEYNSWWRRENSSLVNSYTAKRRAIKSRATLYPSQLKEIELIYAYAKERSLETGEPWSVDHVCPLSGTYVSGLHVLANLRVIKASHNSSKGYSFNPATHDHNLPNELQP